MAMPTIDATSGSLARRLQDLLDRTVRQHPVIRSGVMRIDAPHYTWQGASGVADPDRGVAMLPDDQFQAASITKMVTAATLMTLVEEGRIELDAGIGRYLTASVTSGLHDFEGHDYGPEITPRQLLGHTSGVADFFGDGEPGPGGALPFVAKMHEDPDKLWDPLEILAWTKAHLRPHFAPGDGWHYADTGFVLAGLIIEAVMEKALHTAMRERVFGPLDMDHTYMLFREPARPSLPARPPSLAYAGDYLYGSQRSVSADWAGGGLGTTAHDLARFIRAFAEDGLFRDPATREQMLTWTPTGEPGVYYGLGVRRFVPEELGMPELGEIWGHTGFLKSFMLYWPERDATICGTLNQSAAPGAFSQLRPVAALVPAAMHELRQHSPENGM
jgi:CubicO group peptidase (beta-lactamase class C family)